MSTEEQLPPYQLVTTNRQWQIILPLLQRASQLAIDLESNSMFAYHEQICLIQISTADQDYIIDPLGEIDISALGQIMADPAVQKIFHAVEYDLMLMKHIYGWQLTNVFDTMWAGRILGYEKVGLSNMLQTFFGFSLDKKHQRANWGLRPLSADQLNYAQRDTHYLFRLRNELFKQLWDQGHWAEAEEIFGELCQLKPNFERFNPDDFWEMNGTKHLDSRQMAVLRELAIFRDQEAQKKDWPHYKIFNNEWLIDLAELMPQAVNDLYRLPGLSEMVVRKHGAGIVQAVLRGLKGPIPKRPPRKPRPSENVANRYEALLEWRKERAGQRGVESDVVASRDALWGLANQRPLTLDEFHQVAALGPWRRQQYGEEIVALLKSLP